MSDIFERLKCVLHESLRLDDDELAGLTAETTLTSLDCDSLDATTVEIAAEEAFAIRFDGDGMFTTDMTLAEMESAIAAQLSRKADHPVAEAV